MERGKIVQRGTHEQMKGRRRAVRDPDPGVALNDHLVTRRPELGRPRRRGNRRGDRRLAPDSALRRRRLLGGRGGTGAGVRGRASRRAARVGARSHFLTVPAGCCMLGMDVEGLGVGHGFLAVGGVGTRVRRISIARLGRALRERPAVAAAVCSLVDRWLMDLGRALTEDIVSRPRIDASLLPGERIALENRAEAGAQRGVAWLEVLARQPPVRRHGGPGIRAGDGAAPDPSAQHPARGRGADAGRAAAAGAVPAPGLGLDRSGQHRRRRHPARLFRRRGRGARPRLLAAGSALSITRSASASSSTSGSQTIDELNRLRTKTEYSETARADAYGELVNVLASDQGKAAPAEIQAARRSGARRVLAGRRAAAGDRPLAPRSRSEADLRSARVVDRQGFAAAHASGGAARRLVPPRPRPDGRAARGLRCAGGAAPHLTAQLRPGRSLDRRAAEGHRRAGHEPVSVRRQLLSTVPERPARRLRPGSLRAARTAPRRRHAGGDGDRARPARHRHAATHREAVRLGRFLRPTARWSCRSWPRCSWWR